MHTYFVTQKKKFFRRKNNKGKKICLVESVVTKHPIAFTVEYFIFFHYNKFIQRKEMT